MIVQTSPTNTHLIIQQVAHARMSGQMALAFGNEVFAGLQPENPMIFVAGHHDEGWVETDAKVLMDTDTKLPFHLTKTPITELIQTSRLSPAFNETQHPYAGIISSMHTTGLFNGRYGLSNFVFIDKMLAEHRDNARAMLTHELARQERLKAQLLADPDMAEWATDDYLFHNYKLLQFFDTLSLYFHLTHPDQRGDAQFLNVPRSLGDDVTVEVGVVDAGIYRLNPYPFAENNTTFSYKGQWLSPQPVGVDLKAVLEKSEVVEEKVTLVC